MAAGSSHISFKTKVAAEATGPTEEWKGPTLWDGTSDFQNGNVSGCHVGAGEWYFLPFFSLVLAY